MPAIAAISAATGTLIICLTAVAILCLAVMALWLGGEFEVEMKGLSFSLRIFVRRTKRSRSDS